MEKEMEKARIIETLKREEIKPVLEYVSSNEELYHLCEVFLKDIEQSEFEVLLMEIMQEENLTLNDDLQEMAAGLKVGSLYIDK